MVEIRGLPAPGGARALGRAPLRALLSKLAAEAEITATEYVPPKTASGGAPDEDWPPRAAARAGTGLVLVDGPGLRLAIAPPFPLTGGHASWPGPDFGPLRELIDAPRTVAVVLLRLGRYAVGVIEDGTLAVSKTGTRYVHGRHRAGGQSQRRFERNREKWIGELFDEVCNVARDRFGPYRDRIDHLALGGDRIVLGRFMKRCDALRPLQDRLLPAIAPVERPGLAAIRRLCNVLWSSRVYRAPRPQERRPAP